jgi:hypothetical protein
MFFHFPSQQRLQAKQPNDTSIERPPIVDAVNRYRLLNMLATLLKSIFIIKYKIVVKKIPSVLTRA